MHLRLHSLVAAIATNFAPLVSPAQPALYGEPVELFGRAVYFTSWKYVRPGSVGWQVQPDPAYPDAGKWMKSDGSKPARFTPRDMRRGIRLCSQRRSRVPLAEGHFAAQLFDEKIQIARRLRQETTMTWAWIAERLKMGAPGAVANLLRNHKRL